MFAIIWLLHSIIGVLPALAGFAVTILLVPLNTVVGKIVHKYRKDLIAKTDARVKLISEIINGAASLRDASTAVDVLYMPRYGTRA